MTPATGRSGLDELLAQQVAYYRALAGEYEDHILPFPGGDELSAALDAFQPTDRGWNLRAGPSTPRSKCRTSR